MRFYIYAYNRYWLIRTDTSALVLLPILIYRFCRYWHLSADADMLTLLKTQDWILNKSVYILFKCPSLWKMTCNNFMVVTDAKPLWPEIMHHPVSEDPLFSCSSLWWIIIPCRWPLCYLEERELKFFHVIAVYYQCTYPSLCDSTVKALVLLHVVVSIHDRPNKDHSSSKGKI